jgi:hypothetical protein
MTDNTIFSTPPSQWSRGDLAGRADLSPEELLERINNRRHHGVNTFITQEIEKFGPSALRFALLGLSFIPDRITYKARDMLDAATAELEKNRADPEAEHYVSLLRNAVYKQEKANSRENSFGTPQIFPGMIHVFDEFSRMIDEYILNTIPKEPLISRDTKIIAVGSCFAINISKHLRALGMSASTVSFPEVVNNAGALDEMVRWAFSLTSEPPEYYKTKMTYREMSEIKIDIFHGECFILTIGLSVGNVHKQDSNGNIETYYDAFTVEYNVEKIMSTIETIKYHKKDANIFLTVSPVPLRSTLMPHSAVIMDCVSKSFGRAAVHTVISKNIPGVRYWPSYEIVRWMAPMLVGPLFGMDDGHAHHVSTELISLIMEKFTAHYLVKDQ